MTANTTDDKSAWERKARELIKQNEGSVPHPYLDTDGNLTIGYGFLIENENDFVDLDLEYVDEDRGIRRRATENEKRA